MGHQMGDLAIVNAANILKTTFRRADIIGRLGGDEFAVLAMKNNKVNEESLHYRLQNNINALNQQGNLPFPLSLSAGYSTYSPKNKGDLDSLIAEADKKMYENKQYYYRILFSGSRDQNRSPWNKYRGDNSFFYKIFFKILKANIAILKTFELSL